MKSKPGLNQETNLHLIRWPHELNDPKTCARSFTQSLDAVHLPCDLQSLPFGSCLDQHMDNVKLQLRHALDYHRMVYALKLYLRTHHLTGHALD